MKNVLVIDKAENSVYDIFGVADDVFALIFPKGTDIAFAEDLRRHRQSGRIWRGLGEAWRHRVPKALVRGIHGTLFYELEHKRQYYPTRRDEEAINPDASLLRESRPPQRTKGSEAPGEGENDTQLANVDFEVYSREPLDGLVAALGRRVFVLYEGRWTPGHAAMFELSAGWNWPADRRIMRFVQLIEALPRRDRRLWDSARVRRFDIGINAGHFPKMFQLNLKPTTVDAVGRIGGEIVVSVYAPPDSPVWQQAKGRRPTND